MKVSSGFGTAGNESTVNFAHIALWLRFLGLVQFEKGLTGTSITRNLYSVLRGLFRGNFFFFGGELNIISAHNNPRSGKKAVAC